MGRGSRDVGAVRLLALTPIPETSVRIASPWRAALLCRCPRCGEGRLYAGLLSVRDRCAVCGLDLRGADAGDGAAVGVIFVLSVLVIGAALWVDVAFRPPLWVHAVIWPIVMLPLAVVLMRPAKAALIWSQYRNRPSEMGL